MQMETEITVLVKSDYETLQKELKEKGFQIDEEYTLNDVYMLDERIDISNMSYLEILKNCILVRNIIGFEMELLYKYKKYDTNGDILEQGKVKCPITDVDKQLDLWKLSIIRECLILMMIVLFIQMEKINWLYNL